MLTRWTQLELRKALDDGDQVLAVKSQPTSLSEQLSGLGPNDSTLGFTRNTDTATTAKLEDTFVSKNPKSPQDGVGVHPENGGHISGGREALTWTCITVCNVTADLGCDLVVES